MSYSNFTISSDHFQCSICMGAFTHPVTTPCGHNYCKDCITRYWDTSNVCLCPLCKQKFKKRPKVSVNTFISQMAEEFKKQKLKKEYEAKTEAEIQQMIQERQEKIQEAMRSVELSRKDAFTAMSASVQALTAMNSRIQQSQAEIIDVIEEKQKTREKQAEGVVTELKQEIAQLEKRISELRHTEDHQNLTSTTNNHPPSKDWTTVNIHQSSLMGTVRTAVSQLEETLSKGTKNLGDHCDDELRMIQQYKVDVTLDPDTAHGHLILSEDRKQVSYDLPDNTESFYPYLGVLGQQSFSSGRFYYEVQVGAKTTWDLGVAKESINRKEVSKYERSIKLTPRKGFWTIRLRNGNKITAAAHGHELLQKVGVPSGLQKVQKVGVFVDYEEGLVSFYDVEASAHLYSYIGCCFTERLYPCFSPRSGERGRNSAPLIISPVNTRH